MIRLAHAQSGSRDSGAAAVEFALVLIPLLLIVFGIVNFGVIFASQIGLNSSARDASRAGVVQPLDPPPLLCKAIAVAARNNGGAFPTNTTAIEVTVTGPAGTCSLASGAASSESQVTVGPNIKPCEGSSPGDQLSVVLRYTHSSLVPLVPPTTLNQTATGSFRCEYS